MKIANHLNFVSIMSEEKPPMVFFHYKDETKESKKIKTTLALIQKELPLLSIYEFIIDENINNEIIADYMDLNKTPIVLFFKNGGFHRYKDKNFTKPSLMHFIGNKKLYKNVEDSEKQTNEKTITA